MSHPAGSIHPSLSRNDVVRIVAWRIEGKVSFVETALRLEVLALMGAENVRETLEAVLPNNEGSEREGMVADLTAGIRRLPDPLPAGWL